MKSIISLITVAATLSLHVSALAPVHPQLPLIHPSTVKEPRSKRADRPKSDAPDSLNGNNLSPFLQEMVDEQREFQMNVGRAMDVLRKDYPEFLRRSPDYSIYSDSVSLTSSTTPLTKDLVSYKNAFAISRSFLTLLYDPDRSTIQSRMVYDSVRCKIRISFNAELVPRNVLARRVYIDGISVYSFDLTPTIVDGEKTEGGKIVKHRIEKMLVNGRGVQPPYLSGFGLEAFGMSGSGALVGAGAWS